VSKTDSLSRFADPHKGSMESMLRFMTQVFAIFLFGAALVAGRAEEFDVNAAPHFYREATPRDRFSLLKAQIEDGRIALDRSSELAFLRSLLEVLEVSASSQLLVFSTTSLQLSLITPSNPRALYFNEDTYLGFIPGGKIEIISLDPTLGAIFHIFDIPRGAAPIVTERSGRCMNCHSGSATRFVPGLTILSVVPGSSGGSLDAFRNDLTGHAIPFSERFGGWYLTGAEGFTNHWANTVGRMQAGNIQRTALNLGEKVNLAKYPRPSSDLLPHLLHEHQAGFVNLVVEAGYRARGALHRGEKVDSLRKLAAEVCRYILFADEAPLPAPVAGEEMFKCDFRANRKTDGQGRSLKDFELTTRLFKHRCSYMIYSPVFAALPAAFKEQVFDQMERALSGEHPDYAYLDGAEREGIRSILNATLNEKRRW
jgi:hypothetical protein